MILQGGGTCLERHAQNVWKRWSKSGKRRFQRVFPWTCDWLHLCGTLWRCHDHHLFFFSSQLRRQLIRQASLSGKLTPSDASPRSRTGICLRANLPSESFCAFTERIARAGMAETALIAQESCRWSSASVSEERETYFGGFSFFLSATVMWECVSLRPPGSETLVSTARGGREPSGCREIATRRGVLYISTSRTKSSHRDAGEYLNKDGRRRLRCLFDCEASSVLGKTHFQA